MRSLTANPLLPIASYSLSLVYVAVAGKSASQFAQAFSEQNDPLTILNAGNLTFSTVMATALVTTALVDSNYNNFQDFFQDCKTGLRNIGQSIRDTFTSSTTSRPASRNPNYAATPQRQTYHSSKHKTSYYDTGRGWETWAPKAILAASSLALAYTFATELGKTVLEYGCEVGTTNQSACEFLGLEYNERQSPNLWDIRP